MSAASGGQVLLSVVTVELVQDLLKDGITLVDRGQHRLRNMDRPERLFQLSHPDLASEFAPLKKVQRTPNNLPTQLTTFIGREEEMTQVQRLLDPDDENQGHERSRDQSRLITLTGPGGTGKTRLSLEVAQKLVNRFPGGVWLVELAPLGDPEKVVQAAAEVVGVRDQPGRPLIDLLVDHLADQTALMILDNCEHVIDACADLAGALLRGCPNLTILASSREALGIAGERAYRVRSLSLPKSDQPLPFEELSHYDAVRLFETRATEQRRRFVLSEANAMDILQICRRLDGIPLAIELAAAKVRVLTPAQILDRLDDRFRLLTGGSRTAVPRQRTLQSLIDWSYDLLSEEECILLRRLSVFSGGWTLEAAEEIAGFDPLQTYKVLELLEQLNRKSLVSTQESELGMRYRMLETVRQYAQEKLVESGEADSLRDRHLAYFLRQTQEASEAKLNFQMRDWTERLVSNIDNHRAARGWALENDLDSALRLLSGISTWTTRIYPFMELLNDLNSAIEQAKADNYDDDSPENSDRRQLLSLGLSAAAYVSMTLGLDKIEEYSVEALRNTKESDDVIVYLAASWIRATSAALRGNLALAKQIYLAMRPLIENIGPNWIQAMQLMSFRPMLLAPTKEGLAESWQDWETAMGMFRKSGDLWGLGFGHWQAAGLFYLLKDFTKSQYHAERSLALFEEIGAMSSANIPRSRLADLARRRGDLAVAVELYREVAVGWRNAGNFGGMARVVECQAFIVRLQAENAQGDSRMEKLVFAATLLGATDAIRKDHKSTMNFIEQSEYDDELVKLKEAIGESLFQESWRQGQEMTPDEVIELIRNKSRNTT